MIKPRILFDLDDTLTNFISELVIRYNKKYGTNFTTKDCYKWELNEIFEHNILELIDEENFFESVEPKQEMVKYMKKWIDSELYDIFIVTSCLKPENYVKKIEWFKKHLPFFPLKRVIPLSEKSAVWGDILIDDNPKNLSEWYNNSRGCYKTTVLFDATHNQKCNEFLRVSSFKELDILFESLFY